MIIMIFKLLRKTLQLLRVYFYKLISDANVITKGTKFVQPVLMTGKGEIILGKCQLGVWPSPFFFSGYSHIEARGPSAKIVIKDGVCINNNATIICDRTSVEICENTLIGPEFNVFDSDFHDLAPEKRHLNSQKVSPVIIGANVFIGARVTVLKGVTIGKNSVIASGSFVTKSIPSDVIASGCPAVVVRYLDVAC